MSTRPSPARPVSRSCTTDGSRPAQPDPVRPRKVDGRPNLEYAHVHHAVDDHSQRAYSEMLADGTKETNTAVMAHAIAPLASIECHHQTALKGASPVERLSNLAIQ
jgi:hypothetical protein